MDSNSALGALPDHLWRPLTQHRLLRGRPPVKMVSAEGCHLTDEAGNRYIDALAGLWCVNVGYGRQELAQAAAEQMQKLNYLAPILSCDPVIEFAEKLQSLMGFECQTYFSVSGSEANETAFKIARQYHLQSGSGGARRYKIISRYRAYHGNTLGAMAATGQAERKSGYDPAPTGFVHVMPPYPFRRNPALTEVEHAEDCAKLLEETIIHEGAETVAAFIMEPVISGGGVLVPPEPYIRRVREICDRYGILLIFDEVVSGFGRLGSMFGFQKWGIEADIFTFAKGLASGYMPVAATVVKTKIFEAFEGDPAEPRHFRQINTYGGHPVASAVALKNIDIVEREDLAGNAERVGGWFRDELQNRVGNSPYVGEIRGMGMLTGIELVSPGSGIDPLDDARVTQLVGACMKQGVLLGRNANTVPGRCNVILVAPPLIADQGISDQIATALADALDGLAK